MGRKLFKWLKLFTIVLAILMIIIVLIPFCGDGVRHDVLVAKELRTIAEVKTGIFAIHHKCKKVDSFILEVNEDQRIEYKCQGPYPLKLSLDKSYNLTNDSSMKNGYPLGLVVWSLEDDGWISEQLEDGRVKIEGPASTHDSGYDGERIGGNHYWIYTPQDGMVTLHNENDSSK